MLACNKRIRIFGIVLSDNAVCSPFSQKRNSSHNTSTKNYITLYAVRFRCTQWSTSFVIKVAILKKKISQVHILPSDTCVAFMPQWELWVHVWGQNLAVCVVRRREKNRLWNQIFFSFLLPNWTKHSSSSSVCVWSFGNISIQQCSRKLQPTQCLGWTHSDQVRMAPSLCPNLELNPSLNFSETWQ